MIPWLLVLRLLFLSEFEDEIEGTLIEGGSLEVFVCSMRQSFLNYWPSSHLKTTLSDLSFINPNNCTKSTPRGIIRLCNRFMTDKPEEIDTVVEEYRAFCVSADNQLPSYVAKADNALEKFWSAMSEKETVAGDLELPNSYAYYNLVSLAKILLVLPNSNADPERLFSMLGKIETQSHSLLSPSTTCDLLTVKMNRDAPCYLSEDLVTDK